MAPHLRTIVVVGLVQLRGDPAQQGVDAVRRACGGMTNLHVMLSILAFMRINPMIELRAKESLLSEEEQEALSTGLPLTTRLEREDMPGVH